MLFCCSLITNKSRAGAHSCSSRASMASGVRSFLSRPYFQKTKSKPTGPAENLNCVCVLIAVQRRGRGKDKDGVGNVLQQPAFSAGAHQEEEEEGPEVLFVYAGQTTSVMI